MKDILSVGARCDEIVYQHLGNGPRLVFLHVTFLDLF